MHFLEKYNKLPYEIRDKVSSPEAMERVAELEKKYEVELAVAVMRVMIKEVSLEDLPKFFMFEHEMAEERARALADEMREKVFAGVGKYLGLKDVSAPVPDKMPPVSTLPESARMPQTEIAPKAPAVPRPQPAKILEPKRIAAPAEEALLPPPPPARPAVKQDSGIKPSAKPLSAPFLPKPIKPEPAVNDKVVVASPPPLVPPVVTASDKPGQAADPAWLTDRKSAASERSASFFFSPEDEEEVKRIGQRTKELALGTSGGEVAGKIAADTLAAAAVDLSSDDLVNRYKLVLSTYVRGVRNRIDTKQTLSKPVDDGGLGLDLNAAERSVSIADKLMKEAADPSRPKAPPRIALPEDALAQAQTAAAKAATGLAGGGTPVVCASTAGTAGVRGAGGLRDDVYDLQRLKQISNNAKIQTENAAPAVPPPAKNAAEGTPAVRKSAGPVPPVVPESKPLKSLPEKPGVLDLSAPAKNTVKAAPGPAVRLDIPADTPGFKRTAPIRSAQTIPAGKTRMDDVKHVPKLTGPIDELREIGPVDFRRLSEDPKNATAKIEKKVSLLEEENYTERLLGIKAWRESPLNRLYLEIGRQSIAESKSVTDVIAARKKAGAEFLTEEEFLAIMDLNKSLRF